MLPASPPTGQSPVIREGAVGWPVFALQTYLNVLNGASIVADGVFGKKTTLAVKQFQSGRSLVADGVAGPATQSRIVTLRISKAEVALPALPAGLLKGQLLSEGGLLLAAVNWSVAGGVDCGATQRRVFGPPYSVEKLEEAFGPICVRLSADEYLERRKAFFDAGAWSKGNIERASRLAAFAHNWPHQGGADFYADNGHVSNPTGIATWLPRDRNGDLIVRFPDGWLVQTRQEWAEFYAMGGIHGPGQVTRFVTSWS